MIRGGGILLVCAGFLLAACGEEPGLPPLTAEGWGGAGAETAFSAAALQDALPGLEVAAGTQTSEGMAMPVFHVLSGDGERLAMVMESAGAQGTVGRIAVFSPRVALEGRVAVGRTYESVAEGEAGFHDCLPGMEEASGTVFCADGKARNVRLQFAGDWAGPDGTLPPDEVLKDWTLRTMVWIAERP